jgi:polyisoprenyl-teichoic acid--peptidoglycan teichoic acid transferase
MSQSEIAIAGRRRAVVSRGAAVAFAGIIASSAVISGPAAERAQAAGREAQGTSDATSLAFTTAQSLRLLGKDGRFTILLLGGDARGARAVGGRTDAMLVASVNPATGRAAIFSIPRDTVNFPLSAKRRYPGKINAIYPYLSRSTKTPGTALRKIVGSAFGIEIDAYALVGFVGFRRLVNNIGGLDVYVAKAFFDRTYSMRRGQRGVKFPAGWNHVVNLRALAFARSRHADSDYARARRQQQLIVAAVQKVRSRSLLELSGLLAWGRGYYKSDLPLTDAPLIYAMVGRANLTTAPRTVFGPRTFATASGARNFLKMTVCKAWIKKNFPAPSPGNAWLPS